MTGLAPVCRRLGALLLLLALAGTVTVPTVQAAPPRPLPGEQSSVAEQLAAHPARASVALRLREGPYPDAEIVLLLRQGDAVHVVAGPVPEGGASWAYVVAERGGERYEGFCASQYLIEQPDSSRPAATATPWPTQPPPPPGDEYQVRVTAYGGLRLRSGPGMDHPVEGIAARHAVLTATGRSQQADGRTWIEVRFQGERLWGASEYLFREAQPTPTRHPT